MNDFRQNIVLKYWYDNNNEYDYQELCSLLGLGVEKISKIVDNLISAGLLEFFQYKLVLTRKGYIRLLDDSFMGYDSKVEKLDITQEIQGSLSEYIPKENFLD